MDRIVIEVDDTVGKAYRNFSPKSKKQFSRAVSILLKKASNDSTQTDYKKMLDEIGREASKNGLTSDTLNELLSSDE